MIKFKDEVLKKNVVIHCDEEWKARNLLQWADSQGLKWSSGESYLKVSNWHPYENATCYLLSEGSLGPFGFFVDPKYKILPYEQVLKEQEMKTGDRVYVSDISEEDAFEKRIERKFVANIGGREPILCVDVDDASVFPDGEFGVYKWKYAVAIPKEDLKKEIIIDGKKIKISMKSFEELKKQLCC